MIIKAPILACWVVRLSTFGLGVWGLGFRACSGLLSHMGGCQN